MKKLAETIRTIGLIANPEKVNCQRLLQTAVALIQQTGRIVLADQPTVELGKLKITAVDSMAQLARQTQLLIVFGGDGTMLRVVRETAGVRTPILGLNAGGLGFLTAVRARELPHALEQIWAGEFTFETRPLIEAKGQGRGQYINQNAFNDFVISRGLVSRLIDLEVSVDDQMLTRYRCDGLIVSSPTGSTAYSLSAGGAIVSPSAEVFALTPICPHTLSNRSVIVSLRSVVKVRVTGESASTTFTADGQVQNELQPGDVITIRRSRQSVKLLRLNGSSFFGTLRQKLHWSGANV